MELVGLGLIVYSITDIVFSIIIYAPSLQLDELTIFSEILKSKYALLDAN